MKILLLLAAFALAASARADMALGGTRLTFASVAEARSVLTNRDDFVDRLSDFDRSARLKVIRKVSTAEYLKFVGTNTLEFSDSEKALIEREFTKVKPALDKLNLNWPPKIQFIKTSGREEGQAAYTRSNAVILPAKKVAADAKELGDLLPHELFHALSRHDGRLKEKLYAVIGFHACDEITLPATMQRITNPDAPRNDHWITLKQNGMPISVIPILFANAKNYDPKRGGEFFDYLSFKLLIVHPTRGASVTFNSETPELIEPGQAEGFFEQVGRNTQYIIHPEEILADNFAMMITGSKSPKSPDILDKLRKVLQDSSR